MDDTEPNSGAEEYKTAPPAPIYVVLTGVLLAIPVIWTVMAIREPPARDAAVFIVLGFLAVAGGTWALLRPSRYRIDAKGIEIQWPLRDLTIPAGDVVAVRVMRGQTLSRELRGVRVGMAGLFGSFGLIRTRAGWATAYMTANDAAVVIERAKQRPLVLTPEDPEGFARAVSPHLGSPHPEKSQAQKVGGQTNVAAAEQPSSPRGRRGQKHRVHSKKHGASRTGSK